MSVRRALIAEDNAPVRQFLETAVGDLGFEVTAVSDGAQAQSRIFSDRPDLFIVDIVLSAVGGQLLISTLKAIRRDAKILAISGMAEGIESAARQAGADAFLFKPFGREELERAIAELFQ